MATVPSNLPAVAAPVNMASLFDAAVKQGSAMEVIRELRQMEESQFQRSAKARFDEAMSLFQDECPVIEKQKLVKDGESKRLYAYAPIEAIEIQIKPFRRKHGFKHSFDTDINSADGWIIAKCIISHVGGHTETSSVKFPLGTKTSIMSATQQYSAAMTFANRRALANAYGLVLAGEDIDGASGKMKQAGPSTLKPSVAAPSIVASATELWSLLKPVRGDKKNWDAANAWMYKNEVLDGAKDPIEAAPNLTEEQFKRAIEKAKKALNPD